MGSDLPGWGDASHLRNTREGAEAAPHCENIVALKAIRPEAIIPHLRTWR